MSIAVSAVAQLALAQPATKAASSKTPPKRSLAVQSDTSAAPEPR